MVISILRRSSLLTLLVAFFLTSACAVPAAPPAATEPEVSEAATIPPAMGMAPIDVVDANGDTVVIDDISRIITLGGPVTELIFALGMGDHVVAVDSSSSYPPEVGELPSVGYQRSLSAEGVLALDPTLILGTTDAGPPETLEQLQNSGITFLLIDTEDTVAGVHEKVRTFAAALDRVDEGEAIIEEIDADLAEAEAIAAAYAADDEEAPSVMFIYARSSGAINVAGTGTGAYSMIELAGGKNAVTEYEGYKPLTAEAAVAAAPDVILLSDDGLESAGGPEGLLSQPGIAQTPAGDNGRIVSMNGLLLLNFGPRMGEAAIELAELIHE